MSLTVTPLPDTREGNLRSTVVDLTLDNSYPAGGEAIDPSWFGFRNLLGLEIIGGNAASAAYSFRFDHTNQKLVAYLSAAHTHDLLLKDADQTDGATTRVNAATNKLGANTGSNITVAGLAAGGSSHGGVVGVAAAALSEVAATTDLSAVQLRVRGFGR